jgi:Fe(3+) dicitrate transport protein
VRWESIRHRRLDYAKTDPERVNGPVRVRTNNVSVVLPGLGVAYEVSARHHFFTGVHRGFAPPGTGSSEDTEPEESLNFELGWRFRATGLSADLTLFHSDYDNLLGVETLSGGGSSAGDLFNGGAVKVRGLEASLSQRWRLGGHSYLPFRLAYTYTVGRFQSSFSTQFADWAPRVEVGDQLPYLPEHQLQLSAGLQSGKWSTYLNGRYMDRMRTSAGQGPIPDGEGTDRRFVVDLSVQWQALGPLAFYGQVRNLTDEVYLVSRRPYGARPGLDRTALFGLSVDF